LGHSLGSDQGFESDLPNSNRVSGSGLVSVAGPGSPPSGYVFGFISPPLPDQFSPMKGTSVVPVKPLDEGLLGAMGLVPMVVVVGSVSPAVEQNTNKGPVVVAMGSVLPAVAVGSVRHSFPVKGMLWQGFLG
jgi:hypothetical protein